MDKEMTKCPVDIQEKKFTVLNEISVHVAFVKIGETFLLVICDDGDVQPLRNLSMAIANCTTNVMGNDPNRVEQSLSQKLSARFNKNGPVYVSFNCCLPPVKSSQFLLEIEAQVFEFVGSLLK